MTDAEFRATAHKDAEGIKAGLAQLEKQRSEDHRILNRVQMLMIAKLITLVMLVGLSIGLLQTSHSVQRTNKNIRDCTSPSGQCFQRNAASTALLVSSIGYTTDVLRLSSELQVAQSNGNDAAVKIRQDQLNFDGNALKMIAENMDDVQHDRPQRNVIPLPTDAPK